MLMLALHHYPGDYACPSVRDVRTRQTYPQPT